MQTTRSRTRTLLLALAVVSAAACERTEPARPAAAPATPPPPVREGVEIQLAWDEIVYLNGVARRTFDLWVKDKATYEPADVPPSLAGRKSNNVFATIYLKGEWRGCVSARRGTLVESVVHAVIATCQDSRFKNPLPDEIGDFRIELSLLGPYEPVTSREIVAIGRELEPGVHGIYLKKGGKGAFFLPYVMVQKRRPLKEWLERLSQKAGLHKGAWAEPETVVYRYETVNFVEREPYGPPVRLYRFKTVIETVDAMTVRTAANRAEAWLKEWVGGSTTVPADVEFFGDAKTVAVTRDVTAERAWADAFAGRKAATPPAGPVAEWLNPPAGLETVCRDGRYRNTPADFLVCSRVAGPELAEGMANWAVDRQFWQKSTPHLDFYGAFPGTGETLSIHENGLLINGLLALEPRVGEEARRRLTPVIIRAVRWLLEQQYTPISAFWIQGYDRYVGAFRSDAVVNATSWGATTTAREALATFLSRPGLVAALEGSAGQLTRW